MVSMDYNGVSILLWRILVVSFPYFFTHSHLHAHVVTHPLCAFAAVTHPSHRDTCTRTPSASSDGQTREDDVYLFSVACGCVVVDVCIVCTHILEFCTRAFTSGVHFVKYVDNHYISLPRIGYRHGDL